MDFVRAREFVRHHHRAVLATRAAEGIQQSLVLVAADEEGRFVVSSREPAYKVKNLRRDPWVQLCVFTDKFFGTWYFVEGEADILSLPEAEEPLVDYYRRAAGEHDDWDAYRESLRQEQRVLIRITARRVGPDRQG